MFLAISSFTNIFNILEPCYKGSSSLLADILINDHQGFQSIFHITPVIEGVPEVRKILMLFWCNSVSLRSRSGPAQVLRR